MQNSYNNSAYTRIQTEDSSLFIPECINWNVINTVGPMPTNYRERLMTENNNTYINSCDVPEANSFTRKRRQFQFKQIDNISSNYDSDDSDTESSLVNVPQTIKVMDILYNTNFSVQLRSEENISTISHYLKNIINKTDNRKRNEVYSIKKIVNVLNWMMQDWKIESIVKVIVNITANWKLDENKKEDSRLGRLIRRITVDWDPQYLAQLVSILFISHPLCNKDTESCKEYKEVFLKVLSKRWKFCRLSQFFICLGNKGEINHKLKMHLLQRAAKYEDNSKRMFNSSQKKNQEFMSKPQYHLQSQPQQQSQYPQISQFQFQSRPQSQSVDNLLQHGNQNQVQSPQIYQTVMILSPSQTQGSPNSTPSPQTTFYQIQDFQRPLYSQSPLNDTISVASSSNSPVSLSISTSPSSYYNSIPIITTTNATNIPMVTIRSMNQTMTMNTQNTVPVVMSPPLTTSSTTNFNPNSPSMILSNITTVTVPSPPNSVASENVIRLPQGTPVFQTVSSQGTNIIRITSPYTTNNNIDPVNDNPLLFSPSTSSTSTSSNTTHRVMSPFENSISSQSNYDISSPSSSTSSHSKLKGKDEEEDTSYYPSSSSTSANVIPHQNNHRQSLLFMTPSSTYSQIQPQPTFTTTNSTTTTTTTSINNTSNSIQPQQPLQSTIRNYNVISSNPINVSVPIPLSLNVRNITQRIADLSQKAEKQNSEEDIKTYIDPINKIDDKKSSILTNNNINTNTNIDINISTNSKPKNTSNTNTNINTNINTKNIISNQSTISTLNEEQNSLTMKEKRINGNDENELANSSLSSSTSITSETIIDVKSKVQDESDEELTTITLKAGPSTPEPKLEESRKNDPSYYEEIFNLDEFNHEEKKAIYDIIDSSKEDLDEIQMEKDEKLRNFIQENKKEFTNYSSTPKTPPPSLASSPYFQK